MNRPEEFDDLLRGKLQEREFPFEEAHWADMQRRIAEDKRRKRRPILFFLIAAGLLGGVGAWYATSDTSDSNVAQRVQPSTETSSTSEVNSSEHTEPDSKHTTTIRPAETPEAPAAPADQLSSKETNTVEAPTGTSTPSKPATPRSEQSVQAPKSPSANDHGQPLIPQQTTTIASSSVRFAPPVEEPDNVTDPAISDPPATTPPVTPAEAATATATDTPSSVVPEATNADTLTDTFSDSFADDLFALSADLEERYPPKDSATATQDPNAPPPAASKYVWRISALGGLQRSFNDHGDVPFGTAYTPLNTGLGGAEFMRMGSHFGFGSGIHILSYAEDLDRQELFKDELSFTTVYSLTPMSVTVPGIVDTVFVGGDTYYVTTPVDTTILVLESDIDTTLTRITTQDAERVRNVLSYVEIPLLLDGHFDTGKWSFGVRGGPTLALLTGRSGAVPRDGLATLMPAEDAPFNSLSFGYVARLYVRYGLGTHWSLGLEPGVRGHFTQALTEAGYSVRPQAYGLHFSLTYLLK